MPGKQGLQVEALNARSAATTRPRNIQISRRTYTRTLSRASSKFGAHFAQKLSAWKALWRDTSWGITLVISWGIIRTRAAPSYHTTSQSAQRLNIPVIAAVVFWYYYRTSFQELVMALPSISRELKSASRNLVWSLGSLIKGIALISPWSGCIVFYIFVDWFLLLYDFVKE